MLIEFVLLQLASRSATDELRETLGLELPLLDLGSFFLLSNFLLSLQLISQKKASVRFPEIIEKERPNESLDGYNLKGDKVEHSVLDEDVVCDKDESRQIGHIGEHQQPVDDIFRVEFGHRKDPVGELLSGQKFTV
jgi:hypothetical protein